MDFQHPIINTLWGHRGWSKRRRIYTPIKKICHYNGPFNNLKLNYSDTTRWEHNGVVTHSNTPATRPKKTSKVDSYFPKNENTPTNISRSII